jgi:hypothetical protein
LFARYSLTLQPSRDPAFIIYDAYNVRAELDGAEPFVLSTYSCKKQKVTSILTSNSVGPITASPVNTVAPAVTGTTIVGETLSCTEGTWTGTAPITYTYQWKRGSTSISGATSATYVLVQADAGENITCDVTATNSVGTATQASNTVGPIFDANAAAYITAVESADTQALEAGVRTAINDFVRGCKADGIWSAIKASCILAGARTLTGALVPLVGTAPTNVGNLFVAGDYNRKTGLVGNGSTKYLDSNRNNNADPQDSKHLAVASTAAPTGGNNATYIGAGGTSSGNSRLGTSSGNATIGYRINIASGSPVLGSGTAQATGFIGVSRSSSSLTTVRVGGVNTTDSSASASPANVNLQVFAANGSVFSNARIAFYSIGESLDLAQLDSRVTALINAFDAAI